MGRPAELVLDMPAAQKIADRYISNQNGPVAINMSEAQYSPHSVPRPIPWQAGTYLSTTES
ncbi:MAG: hypothetical protein WC620_09835 [Methanoregula sp.]|jgi:hypothetical protein